MNKKKENENLLTPSIQYCCIKEYIYVRNKQYNKNINKKKKWFNNHKIKKKPKHKKIPNNNKITQPNEY